MDLDCGLEGMILAPFIGNPSANTGFVGGCAKLKESFTNSWRSCYFTKRQVLVRKDALPPSSYFPWRRLHPDACFTPTPTNSAHLRYPAFGPLFIGPGRPV